MNCTIVPIYISRGPNMNYAERISLLRKVMEQKGFRAYIVPTEDPHQSEYTPDYWKVRSWLSGFTGSAGTLVITSSEAGLWTDFRYYGQAEKELHGSGIEVFRSGSSGVPSWEDWLKKKLVSESRAGICMEQISLQAFKSLGKSLKESSISLVGTEDLSAVIWEDRPPMPVSPLYILSDNYCGVRVQDKINAIQTVLKRKSADFFLLSSLDDIAWVLNLRGSDIEYSPVFLSFMLFSRNETALFINQDRMSEKIREYLDESAVSIYSYGDIQNKLKQIPEGSSLFLSPERINRKLFSAVPKGIRLIEERDVTTDLKSVKNAKEIKGLKKALVKDGIALVQFFYWLEKKAGKDQSELTLAQKVTHYREKQEDFLGNSFNPISAVNEHAAMPHYSAVPESSSAIPEEGIYLLDSGGHYRDGTTDITRTIALGNPTEQQKRDYTLVLKGHIALASAIFPEGTRGIQLDTFARKPLWENSLEYGHGTGHGIGFLLNVHEGPQSISKKMLDVGFLPGMVTSNEPGLYREGSYGIRLENLVLCEKFNESPFGRFYRFETLSLCPFDLNLVNTELLDSREKKWLNAYHEQVSSALSPLLEEDIRLWLEEKTKPV